MKPLKDYLLRLHEKATIEQLADEYRSKGYLVKTDAKVGPYRVDIMAEKDSEVTYIEVKSGKEGPDAKRRIKSMIDYFKEIPHAHFQIYVSRYPEPPVIEFDDIDQVLYNYFMANIPSELDALSTHTLIDDVNSVSVTKIQVGEDIFVSCNGMVSVSLQYGSDAEQEDEEKPFIMSFPFEFEGTLIYEKNGYSVVDCNLLHIDTDAFYE